MTTEKLRGDYLFLYVDDPHPNKGWVLREGTIGSLMHASCNRIHYDKDSGILCLPTDTILTVYKKTTDRAGNIIWVEQSLDEFYQRCVAYAEKRVKSTSTKDEAKFPEHRRTMK